MKIVSHSSCRTSAILKYFCLLVFKCLFLAVQWVRMCVIVAFPGHTQLFYLTLKYFWQKKYLYKYIITHTFRLLSLKAPIATKVICVPRQLKCLRSLCDKQCGPRSDCSRSVCSGSTLFASILKYLINVWQLFAADVFSR